MTFGNPAVPPGGIATDVKMAIDSDATLATIQIPPDGRNKDRPEDPLGSPANVTLKVQGSDPDLGNRCRLVAEAAKLQRPAA